MFEIAKFCQNCVAFIFYGRNKGCTGLANVFLKGALVDISSDLPIKKKIKRGHAGFPTVPFKPLYASHLNYKDKGTVVNWKHYCVNGRVT